MGSTIDPSEKFIRTDYQAGPVVLFGSGETSPSGGRIFEALAQQLNEPPRVAILETPAGFEPNSARVAGRVADFLHQRLQNYRPEIEVIPARKRETAFSPDDPELIRPLLRANVIFMGPGSPTYAVRQLHQSLAWHTLVARHRLGAMVVLASATTVAASTYALPVYEIYKVGEDLHWRNGLDFFAAYRLSLSIIPHWDNAEGGVELDTSRCFMGQERFTRLLALLPSTITIVGIDEHTALVVEPTAKQCQVLGRGGVTVLQGGQEQHFGAQERFPITRLGPFRQPEPSSGLPQTVWEEALAAITSEPTPSPIPADVIALVNQRLNARVQRDWARADELRQRIATLGWSVQDTPEGPRLQPLSQ